jgi:cyclomaltodextrinase / maltogenic alpha-amylase / neopullulanase
MADRRDQPTTNGPDWVRDAVFYQIFPDRFASSERVPKPGALESWDSPPTRNGFKGGDLLGVAEHLDDLQELGITALYLCPIFASASNHRYTTFDYEIVDQLLGGNAALGELLDAAHERGMRVVLDGVFNHAGRGFWPFYHVLENGSGSPYRDWFYLDPEVQAGRRELTAYPGRAEVDAMHRLRDDQKLPFSPAGHDPLAASGADADASESGLASRRILGYKAWWDHAALPKLNHSNPLVREYVYAIVERWLRFGIDGWRLDAPQEVAVPGFWEELRRRVRAVNPEAYLVGEIWTPGPEWLAGDRFDGLMNYPLAEAILSFSGAGRLDEQLVAKTHEYAQHVRAIDGPEFARQLSGVMARYAPEVTSVQLNLLDSHDTPRVISLVSGDTASVRLAFFLLMTLPGAPCIYYGDEVGLAGLEDPDCRRGFPWNAAAQDGSLRSFTAGLIGLRHATPVLRRGRFEVLEADGSAVAFGMFGRGSTIPHQPDDNQAVIVAVNSGDVPARLTVEVPAFAGCTAEQLRWPGLDWRTSFAPRRLKSGIFEVDVDAREGVVIDLRSSRS